MYHYWHIFDLIILKAGTPAGTTEAPIEVYRHGKKKTKVSKFLNHHFFFIEKSLEISLSSSLIKQNLNPSQWEN